MLFDDYGPDNPLIMSAAGLCKSLNPTQLKPLADVADKVVAGSFTLEPRLGNEGICEYFDNDLYGLNAWGMPNPGSELLRLERAHPEQPNVYLDCRTRHQLILSLAEFSAAGYRMLYERLADRGDGVELNFGCPNVRDDGTQHAIVSFDPRVMAATLEQIRTVQVKRQLATFVGVKLSPYSDPGLLKEVAAVIAESGVVQYVAVTNTFPNGLAYTPAHRPALNTRQAGRFGGVSGEALKPISLANAAAFRAALPSSVAVVRVGGISSGEDVWQSYDVGCIGVQVATAIVRRGPQMLGKIRQEYADIID